MKNYILRHIKDLYDFHDYNISKPKAMKMSEIIMAMKETNEDGINDFFNLVYQGKYGTLYKMPTCLISMYYRHLTENKDPFLTHLK